MELRDRTSALLGTVLPTSTPSPLNEPSNRAPPPKSTSGPFLGKAALFSCYRLRSWRQESGDAKARPTTFNGQSPATIGAQSLRTFILSQSLGRRRKSRQSSKRRPIATPFESVPVVRVKRQYCFVRGRSASALYTTISKSRGPRHVVLRLLAAQRCHSRP